VISHSPTCSDSSGGGGITKVLRLATDDDRCAAAAVELICHAGRSVRPSVGPGVSCLRIRYRLAPAARAANLLPISARRAPTTGRRRHLMDDAASEAFEERPTDRGRAGAGCGGAGRPGRNGRVGTRPGQGPGRSLAARYTTLHQRLVEDRRRDACSESGASERR